MKERIEQLKAESRARADAMIASKPTMKLNRDDVFSILIMVSKLLNKAK